MTRQIFHLPVLSQVPIANGSLPSSKSRRNVETVNAIHDAQLWPIGGWQGATLGGRDAPEEATFKSADSASDKRCSNCCCVMISLSLTASPSAVRTNNATTWPRERHWSLLIEIVAYFRRQNDQLTLFEDKRTRGKKTLWSIDSTDSLCDSFKIGRAKGQDMC